MRSLLRRKTNVLLSSDLYNERSFYGAFLKDLEASAETVIIESPFITSRRMRMLYPAFRKLINRGVRITINTRNPIEHEESLRIQAQDAIAKLQNMGVEVLYTGGHHRKLAFLDKRILWEGSLNILSQSDSCEIMRRTQSEALVQQIIRFTDMSQWY